MPHSLSFCVLRLLCALPTMWALVFEAFTKHTRRSPWPSCLHVCCTAGGSMHAPHGMAQAMQMAEAITTAHLAQQAQQQQQQQQGSGQPRPAQAAHQLPHLFTSLQRYLATLNGNLAAVPLALPSRSPPNRECTPQ